jgi:hypothetical protein
MIPKKRIPLENLNESLSEKKLEDEIARESEVDPSATTANNNSIQSESLVVSF